MAIVPRNRTRQRMSAGVVDFYRIQNGFVNTTTPYLTSTYLTNQCLVVKALGYGKLMDARNTDIYVAAKGSFPWAVLQIEITRDIAISKFWATFYDGTDWGETIGEIRQASEMISKRANQIGNAALRLREGNFRGMLAVLGITPKRRHRGWVKLEVFHDPRRPPGQRMRYRVPSSRGSVKGASESLAQLWLEYWMGWAPMVGAIYRGIQILGQDIPRVSLARKSHTTRILNFQSNASVDNNVFFREFIVRVGILGEARVSNPNLWMLQRLGLINPVLVAWRLMRLSFLIDWFIPVGKFLDSFSQEFGLTPTKYEETVKVSAWGRQLWYVSQPSYTASCSASASQFIRYVNLPFAKRRFTIVPLGINVTRALTAVSLCVTQLKKLNL